MDQAQESKKILNRLMFSQCFALMLIGGDLWKNSVNNSVIFAFNEGSDFVWDSINGNNINNVNSEATFDGCPDI